MTIYQGGIFGLIVVIRSFNAEDEAVAMANNTTYGLGATVLTEDLQYAQRVGAEIEAGMA